MGCGNTGRCARMAIMSMLSRSTLPSAEKMTVWNNGSFGLDLTSSCQRSAYITLAGAAGLQIEDRLVAQLSDAFERVGCGLLDRLQHRFRAVLA